MTATPDARITAQQDRAAVERDYRLGVLSDQEGSHRVTTLVRHRMPVTHADREAFEQEAPRRFVAAAREAAEGSTVPANSDDGVYLTIVAIHGRCTCVSGGLCSETSETDNSGRRYCPVCQMLDPGWPYPTLDEDADYPDPDLVRIEGAEA